jgi:hypothetical protein
MAAVVFAILIAVAAAALVATAALICNYSTKSILLSGNAT